MQITDILDNVSKVIVGKEEVTKKVITSILAGLSNILYSELRRKHPVGGSHG